MSDIIYTPPAAGGGGTTINPSDNVVPVRYNSTTFLDSGIYINPINLGVSFPQLNSDVGTSIISIGDVTSNYSSLWFSVDRANEIIYTQKQSVNKGLYLDFGNENYLFGDFNFTTNGIYLLINNNNGQILSSGYGSSVGLNLDFSINRFYFGDYNFNINGTCFIVDDSAQLISTTNGVDKVGLSLDLSGFSFYLGDFNGLNNASYIWIKDSSKSILLNTSAGTIVNICDNLVFNGVPLQSNTAGGSSGEHLVINLNGSQYKIALLNP